MLCYNVGDTQCSAGAHWAQLRLGVRIWGRLDGGKRGENGRCLNRTPL